MLHVFSLYSEHGFEKFSTYSSCGIIVASIEEILNNFTKMVGYHDIKDKQPITEDLLPPKGWLLPVEIFYFENVENTVDT